MEATQPLAPAADHRIAGARLAHVGVGGVALDGLPVAGAGVASQLREGDHVVLSADAEAPFGRVNQVISELVVSNRLQIGVSIGGGVREVRLGRRFLEATSDPALLILVVPSGIGIKAPGGNVAPGCEHPGEGIAIPRAGSALNYAAASACMSRLKAAAAVSNYHLAADAQVPFGEVDATVRALSAGGGRLVGIRVF